MNEREVTTSRPIVVFYDLCKASYSCLHPCHSSNHPSHLEFKCGSGSIQNTNFALQTGHSQSIGIIIVPSMLLLFYSLVSSKQQATQLLMIIQYNIVLPSYIHLWFFTTIQLICFIFIRFPSYNKVSSTTIFTFHDFYYHTLSSFTNESRE